MENGFGAEAGEISGDFGQIWRAFFAAQVLVFRARRLTAAQFLAFARRFGRSRPVTGRKALYAVPGSSFGIEGTPPDEARELLDELRDHATQQKYQLRVKYGVGDT